MKKYRYNYQVFLIELFCYIINKTLVVRVKMAYLFIIAEFQLP